MALTIERESTEYLYVGVTGTVVTGAVEVAFLDAAVRPVTADWETATKVTDGDLFWADAQTSGPGDWYIAKLVGPFGDGTANLELTSGDYQAWIRATDNTERPVRMVGQVTVE